MEPLLKAKKDITVYKIGYALDAKYEEQKDIFVPYYQQMFQYIKFELTPLIILSRQNNINIYNGYHFYSNCEKADSFLKSMLGTYKSKIDLGIFIIPKGTRYYINNVLNVGVAEQLIYIGDYERIG